MTDALASFVSDSKTAPALAAVRALVEEPRVAELLLVVGGRGSGKTHLLEAVRDRVASGDPPRVAALVSLARIGEIVQGRGLSDTGAALRQRLSGADLALFDDLSSIERNVPLQSFLYDLIERRSNTGVATIVASALPLDRLTGLDARLIRRFRAGQSVTLALPDREARTAILAKKMAEVGAQESPELVDAIAALDFGSIKEYLGALQRVLVLQESSSVPLSPADALALIGIGPSDDVPATNRRPPKSRRSTNGSEFSEFDAFLNEVVANVSQQFDNWRERLRDAITHWQAQGLRTRRLELALGAEHGGDPEPLVAEFGHDAEELQRIAAEVRVVAPDLAGAEAFKDPDQLAAARRMLAEARSRRAPLAAPLGEWSLETLGVGSSNRLALEVIRSIVAEPGVKHRPLVLVGPSGVGKTHMLHGLGNALVAGGLAPVVCWSAHSFLGEIKTARSSGDLAQWRARYQWLSGFLLDDIHLLADEPQGQAELLQLFQGLDEGQRPIAFTTAKPLADLDGFDPRLLTRLQAGTVVDIGLPDREVRIAAIKAAFRDTPAANDAGLIDYLAGRPAESVRSIQGAVQRLLAQARADRVVPTAAFAREMLEVLEPKVQRRERKAPAAGSGILSPGIGATRSKEKMILAWPNIADRLSTDW